MASPYEPHLQGCDFQPVACLLAYCATHRPQLACTLGGIGLYVDHGPYAGQLVDALDKLAYPIVVPYVAFW